MKHIYYFTGVLIFLLISCTTKANDKEKIYYLQLDGVVEQDMSADNPGLTFLDSALITIVDKKTGATQCYYSGMAGKMQFKLPLNEYFVISISKNSFVSKTVTVDTRVPAKKLANYVLFLEISLFEKISDVDVSALKKPIAGVAFNSHWNDFAYNYTYTDMINAKLKREYAAYYSKRKTKPDNVPYIKPTLVAAPAVAKSQPLPLEEIQQTITFHVQVLASTARQLNSPIFKACSNVTETYEDGLYKYRVGNFNTLTDAQILKNKLRAGGFTDAFIVAIIKDRRVPVSSATALPRTAYNYK